MKSRCAVCVAVLAAASVMLSGCGVGGRARINPADLAGLWTGSWNNITFSTTGSSSMTVTNDSVAQQLTFVITLGGNVLGGTAPPPQTIVGSYDTNNIVISTNSPAFGNVQINIDKHGNISGSITNLPNANITRIDVSGTVDAHTFAVVYTVHFANATTANGTLTMTK